MVQILTFQQNAKNRRNCNLYLHRCRSINMYGSYKSYSLLNSKSNFWDTFEMCITFHDDTNTVIERKYPGDSVFVTKMAWPIGTLPTVFLYQFVFHRAAIKQTLWYMLTYFPTGLCNESCCWTGTVHCMFNIEIVSTKLSWQFLTHASFESSSKDHLLWPFKWVNITMKYSLGQSCR